MYRTLLIVNPFAGRLQIKKDLMQIMHLLSCSNRRIITEFVRSPGDIEKIISRNVPDGIDEIICCGGDGTLNGVVNSIMSIGPSIPIGYIPCGSTNDFAHSLGIPTDPLRAAQNIVQGHPRPIDIGSFNGRYFIYIASFGLFTRSSYSTPAKAKNMFGYGAYVVSGIKEFFSKQRKITYPVQSVIHASESSGDYIFGAVCNSRKIGGVVKLNSKLVKFDDGLFEVVLIKKPKGIKEFNRLAEAILSSNLHSCSLIEYYRTDTINFVLPQIDWSLDGEKCAGSTNITVKNIHNAIQIIS